ncbi:MAG: hypothetical protein SNH73_00475 [Rikenellaceae bacterium]
MRCLKRVLLLTMLFVGVAQLSFAQYYSWGADRAALRWSRIKGDRVSIIYPDTVEFTARRTLHYLDVIKESVAYDFTYPALEIPFVVHPDNFATNGMVMWAPIRVEFLSTPSMDSYSMPWVKQLAAHEYRHTVQYNNLDRSTLKVFNYILGEQGAAVSLLFPPLYALEGDATLFETQSSSFGRGVQPSFSIGYRALGEELLDERDYLKWRCGTYRGYIPDHYQMGYQMMSYAYDKYGENILDRIFAYTARNPQFISPYSIAMRKYYDTSTKELMYETFGELVDFWASLPQVENTSHTLSNIDRDNFTTYSSPMPLESGEILSLKSDYDDPSRFVLFDPEGGDERVVAYTGSISTRAVYADGRVWWTEYRRSPLFAEDVNSQLCYMDLESGKPKSLKGHKSALYPTPIGDSASHVAYVEYDPTGQYSIVELLEDVVVGRVEVEYPNEVHGMAWDNLTESLYILVTGEGGMWIEQQIEEGFKPLTEAAYITLSSLSARDGKLYYGSIASGKDEVHSLDISSKVECQLSESTFGSFTPALGDGELYMTTYDKFGYHIARQGSQQRVREISYSQLPKNLVNPEHAKWDVVNLDSVKFDLKQVQDSKESQPKERYRKVAHLFNIHSWAPLRYDPFNILNELSLDIGLGATVVSQNLLSTCESYLSYGWDYYQGSILNGGVSYNGLGVVLDLSATYGGEQNQYLVSFDSELKRYCDVAISATLPLYFYRGYHTHLLSLYTGWSYSNGIVPTGLAVNYEVDPATQQLYNYISYSGFMEGVNKLSMGVSYTNYTQSSVRDLVTPRGYTLSASYAIDPTNSEFAQLLSLYGKLYTPGFAQNNSLTIEVSYQDSFGGFEILGYSPLSYMSTALIPHGFSYLDISNNKYISAAVEYKFPFEMPDLNMLDLLYIKRFSLGLGADYASYIDYGLDRSSISSYGFSLITDLNVISMTSASTSTMTLSFYKPQGRSLYFQFGFGLPF